MSRAKQPASTPVDTIKEIEVTNGIEIGGCLDALKEYIQSQEFEDAPLLECIRIRLQAAKNKIERLCYI